MSCTGTCHSHINFTTRGKLLLIDVEKAKRDEFNRRRKIRLQQVRQQSNQIAKEIRDKVRAEKILKYSQDDIKKQAHFEKWEKNQIKTLQDEFNRRALIAAQDEEKAFKEAELADLEKERQQVLEEIAKKRGNLAVLKQRRDKLNDETESFLKTSNAKFNRSLENLRSALISSLPKPDAKKTQFENRPGSEKRFLSPDKISPRDSEGIFDKGSDDSDASVMRVIRGNTGMIRSDGLNEAGCRPTSATCQSTSSYSSRCDALSPEKQSRPKSWSYSPERRADNDCWSSTHKDSSPMAQRTSSKADPRVERKTRVSFQPGICLSDKQFNRHISNSPSKRTAGSVLMSPSKRVASSLSNCSHSKDSSPVRCNESYSPNKYKDELDHSDASHFRSRHVRFEDVASLDDSNHLECPLGMRRRACSEGDSEIQSESDVTWPPRSWNRLQNEDVILYDHCGRTTSKYQPKHTVSVISNQRDDEGLEEEMEACREKALRRHEETLRERRGCRAMYRQRLRAEFSCMISDLANLDKQTRLAKLDSEAKAALIPKKAKKRITDSPHDKSTCKEDPPGRSVVMDCIDVMDIEDSDKKFEAKVTQQDLMDCNLDALDQLLARLKEQRDHLIACQNAQEGSKEQAKQNVQSASVQCSVPSRIDSSTSPRAVSPVRNVDHVQRNSPNKQTRATSPILIEQDMAPFPDKPDSYKEISPPEKLSKPFNEKSDDIQETIQIQTSSQLVRQNNNKQKKNGINKIFIDKNAESTLNDSNQLSSIKSTDESSSVDATSYSFDGVKVEVKVSKNKCKKYEKKVKLNAESATEQKNEGTNSNGVFNKIDSWAKKLAENSSSTGTSYMSPPEELNPDEHKLLISVLEGMDKKNSNPILRMYIQRLLSMSKGSLENMSVSISDDSVKSEAYKSCLDNTEGYANAQDISQVSSFVTAQSHEVPSQASKSQSKHDSEQENVKDSKASQHVKLIIDSDDSSLHNKDETCVTHEGGDSVVVQPDNFAQSSQYLEALSKYNERLKLLTQMMTKDNLPPQVQQPRKSFSENDTSYLNVPSDLSGSVKLTESVQDVVLTRPEESCLFEGKNEVPSDLPFTSSWGIRANILPRPDVFHDRNIDRRPRPPSTINNHHPRNAVLETVLPHELSTIIEADSKVISSVPVSRENQPFSSTEQGHFISKTPNSGEDKSKSEEGSYHTLPPTGFPISSDSSLISSSNVSPVKVANESSLQIFTELPDSSFDNSSAEEVAVSEVFRSLGIGWALSTWRKTHEAARIIEETSSSLTPSDINLGRKKLDEMRCRHSTPIKVGEADKNLQISDSDDSRLTPPSVTLYQRYQNLIRSPSISSSLNDS